MDTGLGNKLLLLGLMLLYIGYLDNQINSRPEMYSYPGDAGLYTVYETLGEIHTPKEEIIEYSRSASMQHVLFTLYFEDGRSFGLNTKNPDKISTMFQTYEATGENLDLWLALIHGEPDYQYIDGEFVDTNPSTKGLIYKLLPSIIGSILFIFIPAESLGAFFTIFFYRDKRFFERDPFCACTRVLGCYIFATTSLQLMAG